MAWHTVLDPMTTSELRQKFDVSWLNNPSIQEAALQNDLSVTSIHGTTLSGEIERHIQLGMKRLRDFRQQHTTQTVQQTESNSSTNVPFETETTSSGMHPTLHGTTQSTMHSRGGHIEQPTKRIRYTNSIDSNTCDGTQFATNASNSFNATCEEDIIRQLPTMGDLDGMLQREWGALYRHVQERKQAYRLAARGGCKNVIPPVLPHPIPPTENTSLSIQSSIPFQYVQDDEMILRVAIYHYKDAKKKQEFLVLGSQPLTAFRDCIYCLSDHHQTLQPVASQAAYFYVEGVCFDDTRPLFTHTEQGGQQGGEQGAMQGAEQGEQQGEDQRVSQQGEADSTETEQLNRPKLSTPIIDWSRNVLQTRKVSSFGPIESRPMQETRFEQLKIRLGAHYAYCHQGDCQHIVVFTDMRSITPSDERNYMRYPLHVYQTALKYRKCAACTETAEYVLFGDRLGCSNPMHLCSKCLNMLHVSPEGEIRHGGFKIYRYHHE